MIFSILRYLLDFIALCVVLIAFAVHQGYGGHILGYLVGGYWNYYKSIFDISSFFVVE